MESKRLWRLLLALSVIINTVLIALFLKSKSNVSPGAPYNFMVERALLWQNFQHHPRGDGGGGVEGHVTSSRDPVAGEKPMPPKVDLGLVFGGDPSPRRATPHPIIILPENPPAPAFFPSPPLSPGSPAQDYLDNGHSHDHLPYD